MKLVAWCLLLANGLAFAWWQGHLSPLWDPPGAREREPLRMSRQLRPEALSVTPLAALPDDRSPPRNQP
jgi:hypothetical protein